MTQNFKPEELAQSLIDVVAKKYSYLAIAEEGFSQLKNDLEKGVSHVQTKEDFSTLAIQGLSHLEDGHVSFVDKKGMHNSYPNTRPINFSDSVTEAYFPKAEKHGPITMAQVDDVFYLRLNSLNNNKKDSFEWLMKRDPPKEQKYIVDLRANSGGSNSLAYDLISFMQGPIGPLISHYHRYRTDEDDSHKLGPFEAQYSMPRSDTPTKNVVVLTGSKTYSSAETTTMHLSAIPGTILIGDTTGGGSANPQIYLLDGPKKEKRIRHDETIKDYDANFAVRLSSWLAYRLDQVLLQGNGIEPHIGIEPKKSIVGKRDLVLEEALNVHSNGYIAK